MKKHLKIPLREEALNWMLKICRQHGVSDVYRQYLMATGLTQRLK